MREWIAHSKANVERDVETVSLIVELLDGKKNAYLTWICVGNPGGMSDTISFKETLSEVPPPLYYASQAGLGDMVRWIVLENDSHVNARGGRCGNALTAASVNGHLDIVQFLLEKGAEVNPQPEDYGHPLRAASFNGYLKIVQFLVEKGADVNAQSGFYGNALQLALDHGHQDVMRFLIENGAEEQ